jgi:hypothetical protein
MGISRRTFLACSIAALAGAVTYSAIDYVTSPAYAWKGIPGVKEVYRTSGRHPEVIYLACPHPRQFGEANYSVSPDHLPHLKSVSKSLANDYGVRSIVIDSVMPQKVNGRYRIPYAKADQNTDAYYASLDEILSYRDWKVFDGERKEITYKIIAEMDPIMDLHEMFVKELTDAYGRLIDENKEKCKSANGRRFLSELADSMYSSIKGSYEHRMESLLDDAKLETLYDLIVIQRENIIADIAKRCRKEGIGPLFAIYGPGHSLSLPKTFKAHGLDYACIIPFGADFEPKDPGKQGMRSLAKLPFRRPGIMVKDLQENGKPLIVLDIRFCAYWA